jgi:hypothetical protein
VSVENVLIFGVAVPTACGLVALAIRALAVVVPFALDEASGPLL